ncbi:unnamed protein product [Hydatigera taeniaeformis]|uniref:Reverse transcriptase domain-containing protein n=1 Tax=Hydatigena taeniaeformis TaxID=6205 RepID=A0A0R3WIP3_HYDTA|nr:unnamed protein product [Hydatigera taeniaeformis]
MLKDEFRPPFTITVQFSAKCARKRRIIAPVEELEYALERGTMRLPFFRSFDQGSRKVRHRRSLSPNFRTIMPIEEFKRNLWGQNKQASSFSLLNEGSFPPWFFDNINVFLHRIGCRTTSSERQTPSTSEEIESLSRPPGDRRPLSFERHAVILNFFSLGRVRRTPNWFNPLSTSSTVRTCLEPLPQYPVLSQFRLRQMEDKISSKERILSWVLSQLIVRINLAFRVFRVTRFLSIHGFVVFVWSKLVFGTVDGLVSVCSKFPRRRWGRAGRVAGAVVLSALRRVRWCNELASSTVGGALSLLFLSFGSRIMLSFDFSTDISKFTVNPLHRHNRGLAPSTINQATFEESLRAIAEDGTDVGFYECSVDAGANDKSVLVTTRSEYIIADTEYHTTLTSELDSQLNLLNEINEQTRKSKDGVTKRIIRTYRELDDLIVEVEEWIGTESTKSTRRHSLSELGWYLANGAVLVVERIYAITSAETKFTVNTLDADGVVCNLVCEQLCERNVSYNNKSISELAMKQTIFPPTGGSVTTHKYFTVHGQLLSMVQVGLPIVFKTMDLPPPITKTQYLSTPSVMDDDFHWKDNYMLFSRFHERKEELKSQYHLYLYNHPEFVDIVKDFLLSILMEKPEDTLNFAADFFTTFSKRQLLPPRLKRT